MISILLLMELIYRCKKKKKISYLKKIKLLLIALSLLGKNLVIRAPVMLLMNQLNESIEKKVTENKKVLEIWRLCP